MFYYLLVNNYGGVPLVTEYASTAIKGYPRATAEQVYTYIIDELKSIISNNRLTSSSATKGGGEASIEAAKALLAKTYLSAAWDLNNQSYFTEAAKYADEVINGRSLTTEFADLWAADSSGDDDAEFIFDIEYDYNSTHDQNAGNRWQSFYSNYYGGAEEGMKNGSSLCIPLMHTLRCFEKGDKRYDATFLKTLLVKRHGIQLKDLKKTDHHWETTSLFIVTEIPHKGKWLVYIILHIGNVTQHQLPHGAPKIRQTVPKHSLFRKMK